MVTINNISKRYGNNLVLDDVNLTIPTHKITSFIGGNGAGKSTLLSIMARLLAPDTGQIFIDDQDIHAYSANELARKVSTLRQTNHVQLRLTVEELVSFGRFPYSKGRLNDDDTEHVNRAIDYMNLGHIRDRYIGQLSGGQRQAAFIAMVIAQDTDYIFLDEPLNNLDMKHSVEIMQLLRRLVDDFGKTIVIVVHDINFASYYSDEIVALKDGVVIHAGPTRDIIERQSLKEVFDLDIHVTEVLDRRFCVYFSGTADKPAVTVQPCALQGVCAE